MGPQGPNIVGLSTDLNVITGCGSVRVRIPSKTYMGKMFNDVGRFVLDLFCTHENYDLTDKMMRLVIYLRSDFDFRGGVEII